MNMCLKRALIRFAFAVGITSAATAVATPRTISINFGSGKGSVSGEYGIEPSSSWNNFSDAKSGEAKSVTVSDGTAGVTAQWWASTVWGYADVTDAALKGYLDDGACGDGSTGDGAHIGIFNIPFAHYDVIIYHATDSQNIGFFTAALSEWTAQTSCGSQAHSYDGSFMANRNDSSLKFGQTRQATATVGTNVSYLRKGFTWRNLDIKGGKGDGSVARGGIAAIQIVEVEPSDVFSVNFGASTDARKIAAGTDPGGYFADSRWHNASAVSGSLIGGVNLAFSSKNLYNQDSQGKTFNKGYLDDGSGVSITVSDLANGWYDVVVYAATDNASRQWTYKTINGKNYYWDSTAAKAVEGTSNWGANTFDASATEPGTHALLVSNVIVSDGTITISSAAADGGSTFRSCISAIQLKKVGPEYTANVSGNTAWSEISWSPAPTGVFENDARLTITATEGAEITFDQIVSVPCSLTINGDVLLKADDTFFTDGCYEKAIATFGSFTAANAAVPSALPTGFTGAYALTGTGLKVRAQNREVISINIGGGNGSGDSPNGNLVPANDTYYGLAPVKGETWNNISKQWQSLSTITLTGSKAAGADGSLKDRPTIDLSASSKNTWSWSCTDPFLTGYLDDLSGVDVSVHGVPYTRYDVIVYCTSDNANISNAYVTINGKNYTCGADGIAYEGTTGWGAGQTKTAQFGKNAMYVSGLSGEELSIQAVRMPNAGPRGTLCAVQVINQGEILLKEEFTATISASTAFSDITWDKTFAEGQLNEATINVADGEGEVEITFDNPDILLAKLVINSGRDVRLTASAAPSRIGQLILTGCTAKVTYNYPVDALQMTTDGSIVYAGGAGSETKVANIGFVENGGLTLTGGSTPYYIGDTFVSATTPYAMTFTDATVHCKGGSGLSVGTATVTIGGASQVTAEKFILSQGVAGQNAVIVIEDTASVSVTGTTDANNNQSSVMFGHWKGPSTFTLRDGATFTAASQVLVGLSGGNQTINLNGGTFTAKGIRTASYADETNTLNLNGGSLVLGAVGISSYADNRFITVNVLADTTITSTAAMPITQPVAIADGKTLTLDATAGDILVSGVVSGEGTITVAGGNVTFMESSGVTSSRVTVTGGKAYYGYVANVNDMGTFAIPQGLTAEQVKVYDRAGNLLEATPDGQGNLTFTWEYTGGVCWWDYEFDGNLNNVGGSGHGAMTKWGSDPTYTDDNQSLYIHARPSIDVSSWPTTATFVMYGKMVGTTKTYQLSFGSAREGTKKTVFLATEDSLDSVSLNYGEGPGTYTQLCKMSVPNAQAANHLYAFVLKSDGTRTVMTIYLDGDLLQTYLFNEVIALGGGFQIGSPHGSMTISYANCDASDSATLDWLRVYDVELSAAVIAKFASIYPYVSTNGKATRSVGSSDTTWDETGKWTQTPFEGESVVQSKPNASTMVELTVEEKAKLAMNLSEEAHYESFNIKGNGTLTLTRASGSVVPSVSGKTTIGADVTLAYDALTFGNVSVAAGKTLTFDFASFDLSKEWMPRSIKLTGSVTLGEGAKVEAANLGAVAGRTAAFVYNEQTGQYSLEIGIKGELQTTVEGTVDFGSLAWKMGEDTVTPDWATVPSAKFVVGDEAVLGFATDPAASSVTFAFAGENDVTLSKTCETVTGVTYDFTALVAKAIFSYDPNATVKGGTVRYNLAMGEKAASTVMGGAGTYEFLSATIDGSADGATIRVAEGDTVTLKSGTNDARSNQRFDVTGGTLYLGAAENAAIWYGAGVRSTVSGGKVIVRANGQGQTGNGNGLLLGWSGGCTLDVLGGELNVENSSINFWAASTLNITGGVVKAKGIFAGQTAGTVNIGEGGVLTVGDLGIKAGSCAITNDGTLNLGLNSRGLTLAGAGDVTVTVSQEEAKAEQPIVVFANAAGAANRITAVYYMGRPIRFVPGESAGTITPVYPQGMVILFR